MPRVLIVAAADLTPELGRTVLWRSDIERVIAPNAGAALQVARNLMPRLAVLDGVDLGATLELMRRIREDPGTRNMALAVLSRSPTLADEELLRRDGANAVLSGEVDPFLWDSRLEELLNVPLRREVRLVVEFEIWSHFAAGGEPTQGLAVNLSTRGVLMDTVEPVDVGTKIELRFTLPGDAVELKAVGQVVRETPPGPDGRARSGVEFLILRGDARERISAFVEAGTRR